MPQSFSVVPDYLNETLPLHGAVGHGGVAFGGLGVYVSACLSRTNVIAALPPLPPKNVPTSPPPIESPATEPTGKIPLQPGLSLYQGCLILLLENHCSADYSSNPN